MSLSKIAIYTTASLAIGSTLLWLYSKLQNAKTRRRFRKRNIQYVDFPGFISLMFNSKHFEKVEYEYVQKYGKVFATKMFGSDTIFVTEPELIQQVLSKEFTSFTNRRVSRVFFGILNYIIFF